MQSFNSTTFCRPKSGSTQYSPRLTCSQNCGTCKYRLYYEQYLKQREPEYTCTYKFALRDIKKDKHGHIKYDLNYEPKYGRKYIVIEKGLYSQLVWHIKKDYPDAKIVDWEIIK